MMGEQIRTKIGQNEAWTPEALIAQGFDRALVLRAIVDGKRAIPAAARTKVQGRGRTAPTLRYVWGPDFLFLLGEA